METVEELMKYIATNGIKWVALQFITPEGRLASLTINSKELLDYHFVKGYPAEELKDIFSDEVLLRPDPSTAGQVAWESATIRMFCDIIVNEGERYLMDPRYIGERADINLKALGITRAGLSSEIDFYVLDNVVIDRINKGRGPSVAIDSREAKWAGQITAAPYESGELMSQPFDSFHGARNQLGEILEDTTNNIIEKHGHGEGNAGQQNIKLVERKVKEAGDAFYLVKYLVRNLAQMGNTVSTFMPYPIIGDAPSDLNIYISLWKRDSNIFYDGSAKDQTSKVAYYFIGGILDHAEALTALLNPTTNSYKRLEIREKYISWRDDNKGIVKITRGLKNIKGSKTIVYTGGDPSINPYLAYSALIAAGMDGIKKKKSANKEKGKKKLPESLEKAIEALESDTKFLKGFLTAEMFDRYIEEKKKEIKENKVSPSIYEYEKYFNI